MTRFLSEEDVRSLVSMPLALEAVQAAFRSLGSGRGANIPRDRLFPGIDPARPTSLQVMSGALPEYDAMGLKVYSTAAGGARFLVLVYRASTGELRGIVEADWLGRFRTGAATGFASSLLARPDSATVAIIGAGGQAVTQLLALVTAMPQISHARVWSRSEERRATFAEAYQLVSGQRIPHLDIAICETPEDAIVGADVVIAITSARTPVVRGEWIRSGMHVVGAGINRADVAELDSDVVSRADLVVVDHLAGAMREAGDLIAAHASGHFDWSRAVELGAIVAGTSPGRTSQDQVTLFESQGIAIEDVALATLLLDRAEASGIGDELSIFNS